MVHHSNELLLVTFALNQAATFLVLRQGVVRGTLPLPSSLNRKHGGLAHVLTLRESG
jgi:hypothetical protein